MRTQEEWIELYKKEKNIRSDRQLAFHWNTSSAEIRQFKIDKRRLRIAQKLQIAKALCIDPIQVLISCEYYKAKPEEQEYLKTEYFKSMMKTYQVTVPTGFYKKQRVRRGIK